MAAAEALRGMEGAEPAAAALAQCRGGRGKAPGKAWKMAGFTKNMGEKLISMDFT